MLILLTGCVRPSDKVYCLNVKSVEERLDHYKRSIDFWLTKTNVDKIVFCDNSNYIFDDQNYFEELAFKNQKQIEFLTFQGDIASTEKYGKGYGEGEIIKYFIENSKLLENEEGFYKITGRLYIKNFNSINKHVKKHINYFNKPYLNSKNLVDTRFFKVNIADYKNLFIDAYKLVNDIKGKWLEHVFYEVIKTNNLYVKSFDVFPKIIGCSGSTGVIYEEKFYRYWLKNILLKLKYYQVT